MGRKGFVATAWTNGQQRETGAGYGLKVEIADRDTFFDKSWKTVKLNLVGTVNSRMTEVNIEKCSFWNDICRELISKDIGRWFIDNKFVFIDNEFVPWPKGCPPRFRFVPTNEREFEVKREPAYA